MFGRISSIINEVRGGFVMPDLNPLHYVLAGALALLLILGGMYWYKSHELRTVTAEYAAFVANTRAEGEKAHAEQAERSSKLMSHIVTIEKELSDANTALSKSYADYARLRRNSSSGGSSTPSLADAASQLSCPNAEARLAGSLEQLEIGVLERLAYSRDEAINRTIACKVYLEQQMVTLEPTPVATKSWRFWK